MDHVRLYRNELTHLGYGNPVWEPNPDTLYDRVRIGDVGYFQNEKFVPLFNILPPEDSTRHRRLPFPQPNFPALYLPDGLPTSHNTNPLQAGVYALESSLNFSASVEIDGAGSVLHGESSLSFTNEKGAALILPSEAGREDTLYDLLFKKHMLKYYRQWYNFALTECHRNVKLHDVILVTGCDLTFQWATATYFRNNREISAALGAQVAPVAEARFSLGAGWRTTQAMNTRRGPPQAIQQQPRQDNDETQNESETLVNNQCIFLRGFYVKDRLWGPRAMKAGAGYHDPGKHGPEEEGPEGVLADDDVSVESLLPSTQGETFMTVLLDYMLEESDADIVIANDSDLWPYLGEAANPESLRDTLKRISPSIKVEDRVGSLVAEGVKPASISSSRSNASSIRDRAKPSIPVQVSAPEVPPAIPPPKTGQTPNPFSTRNPRDMNLTPSDQRPFSPSQPASFSMHFSSSSSSMQMVGSEISRIPRRRGIREWVKGHLENSVKK